MEESVKAYLAGIVDGEGTVTLVRSHKNKTPCPEVSVSNTSLILLKWIQRRAGGVIASKNTSKPNHSVSYVWRLRYDKALCFLNEIKEYLIIKRRHAELITQEYKKVTHRAGKYTPQLLKKKDALVQRIRKLNQR
ncbi:MAG: hypothetical protein ABH843_05300 [Candidatus Omnitrophota bacterium]